MDGERGWFVCTLFGHYFEKDASKPACGKRKARRRRWELAQDIGKVRLCEGCKRALRAPRETKR